MPLILDVDTGVDDALALALAVRSPDAELVAVTTVAGNIDVSRATSNSLAVLDWLGATTVPVHRGASRPLVRPNEDATHIHGTDGLGNAGLPASDRSIGADRGPAAIIRLARARPGELTLVCLGPLTNLAIALNVEPGLPGLLKQVVIMGGAFFVGGNVTRWAEYNIYADPESAAQVLATPFPRAIVVGLDVTHQTALRRSVWAASGARSETAAQLTFKVSRETFEDQGNDRMFLHDPLAVAVALDAGLVECERRGVTVQCEGEQRGATRVDGEGSLEIARRIDALGFLARFETVLGLG
jgi:inosine-uridine nucleoside N-ribohydrolase